jgi:MFS superfamily sulfate permease-like transporter
VGFKIEGDGFILSLINFFQRLGEIHWVTLIGLAALGLLIWLPRRYPRLPALTVVALFMLLVGLFGLDRLACHPRPGAGRHPATGLAAATWRK